MKQPPCINLFLKNTFKGNRNENFFKAMCHLRKFNPKNSSQELYNYAKKYNKLLKNPLHENEVLNVVKHATKKDYSSHCNKFKKYCQRCNFGSLKPKYKQYKKNYWKTINKDNTIKKSLTNGLKLYPWDIEDLKKLSDNKKESIKEFRIEKGINPEIDNVLKLRGIKIGEKALNEWFEYRGGKNK